MLGLQGRTTNLWDYSSRQNSHMGRGEQKGGAFLHMDELRTRYTLSPSLSVTLSQHFPLSLSVHYPPHLSTPPSPFLNPLMFLTIYRGPFRYSQQGQLISQLVTHSRSRMLLAFAKNCSWNHSTSSCDVLLTGSLGKELNPTPNQPQPNTSAATSTSDKRLKLNKI